MKKHQTNTAVGKPYGNADVINRGTELEYIKGSYNFDHGTVTSPGSGAIAIINVLTITAV